MRSFILSLLLVGAIAKPFEIHNGTHYSNQTSTRCFSDRGLVEADGYIAKDELLGAIRRKPVALDEKGCLYKKVESTVLWMCNLNKYRNVTFTEAEAGWNKLVQKCGGGGSFAGEHRANGLKFAAYGTKAGKNIRQKGKKANTSPNRSLRLGRRADCNDIGTTGVSHFDCPKPDGHVTDGDGNCPGFDDTDKQCTSYCEVRRTGFLGPEEIVPGEAGEIAAKGKQVNVEHGLEISITHGFSIDLGATILDAVSLGVSYQFSITNTKSTTVVHTGVEDPPERARWVYFARFIETCGDLSEKEYSEQSLGDPFSPLVKECNGDLKTTHNFCTMSPQLDSDGKAVLFMAQQFVNSAGDPLPLDQQPTSYRDACVNGAGESVDDPDGDGEFECATGL
ncbi:hypothetical protein BDV96DRAFT_280548 [Lophiotrema nucula]|uniref:Uncharacterized protein n=1 Tax=Lophiotrema nucula TaxID=690887 RepID=A0A6A5ZMJ4_9PLEO|nr:hypothetical protein BDV96DRAFT_280548 [Lophiotrema nucula]